MKTDPLTKEAGAPATTAAPERAPEPYVRPDLYDLLFTGLDFDRAYFLELGRAADGPVLDLCCGTGRLLVPLLEAGVDVDGVDLHPQMLERARQKTAAAGFHPLLVAADMRQFEMPRRYAAVFIPFNAFAHNLTTSDQQATLACCFRHLLPGGLLAFDAFHATAEMRAEPSAPPVLEIEVAHPDDGHPIQCWDGRHLDLAAQVQHSRMEIRELGMGRELENVHRFETYVRWVELAEIEDLLRGAGFDRIHIAGGYGGEPITESTSSLVIQARRRDDPR